MTDKEAIERLKRIDIRFFLSGMYEQSDYIVDEADKTNKAIETVLNLIQTQQAEIEKKDKIIDLMAKAIGDEPLPTEEYCIFRNFDCPAVGGNRDCKECVKQHFERKVENGN